MAEAEYWRFTVARDCQKKNTSENHSGYSLQDQSAPRLRMDQTPFMAALRLWGLWGGLIGMTCAFLFLLLILGNWIVKRAAAIARPQQVGRRTTLTTTGDEHKPGGVPLETEQLQQEAANMLASREQRREASMRRRQAKSAGQHGETTTQSSLRGKATRTQRGLAALGPADERDENTVQAASALAKARRAAALVDSAPAGISSPLPGNPAYCNMKVTTSCASVC